MAETALRPIGDERPPNRPPLPDGLDPSAMVGLYRTMALLRKFELAAQAA